VREGEEMQSLLTAVVTALAALDTATSVIR
jgi:hypothetical protein